MLGSVSLAVLDGKIHAVGGRDTLSVGTHRVYDPATNKWSERAPLPIGRDHMRLVAINGKLYAVGERISTFEYNTNYLDVYDQLPTSGSQRSLCRRPAVAAPSRCSRDASSFSAASG